VSDLLATFTIPVRTVSEANQREHWSRKHKRKKAQQEAAFWVLGVNRVAGPRASYSLRLTRIAPRTLDADNLAGCFKHIIDAVAKWLGVDDRHIPMTFAQEKASRRYAVRVEVFATFP